MSQLYSTLRQPIGERERETLRAWLYDGRTRKDAIDALIAARKREVEPADGTPGPRALFRMR